MGKHGYDRKGEKVIKAFYKTGNSDIDYLSKITGINKKKVKKTLDTEKNVYGVF